jgi:hypothetical protein
MMTTIFIENENNNIDNNVNIDDIEDINANVEEEIEENEIKNQMSKIGSNY